mmetsp:Transcript_53800/g.128172  ORF Transcript_53800/g.128172 Transcript_53800/m.128172 type:complete len:221 (-) Transcript_53800:46-708(-)
MRCFEGLLQAFAAMLPLCEVPPARRALTRSAGRQPRRAGVAVVLTCIVQSHSFAGGSWTSSPSGRLQAHTLMAAADKRKMQVVRAPGDGSCLFHSLAAGLGNGCTSKSLREEICDFISRHADLEISGTPLRDWILWESELSVAQYVSRMRKSSTWGGAIEMLALANARNLSIRVFQLTDTGEMEEISSFSGPSPSATLDVLYQGGVHYDALLPVEPRSSL